VPKELNEAARSFGLTPWQKFWQLETPFAMPGLIYNMMMSMSGGWFFVVASEAISVGPTTIKLPGVGSWLAAAIEAKDISAVLAAVAAMLAVIVAYDQLLFRPIVAFGARFRVELSAGQTQESSIVSQIFLRSRWMRRAWRGPARLLGEIALLRLAPTGRPSLPGRGAGAASRLFDIVWFALLGAGCLWGLRQIWVFTATELQATDVAAAIILTLFTMLRVIVLMTLATLVWTPIGVWIGLRPNIAEKVQPLAQFLAAFPANVLFPIAVVGIVKYSLDPDIWLSLLIIFGTQWYIAFNVIAGAAAFPNDLREVAANFRIGGLDWWTKVILPGVFPYYVTGAITASGGSWNAAIVAEYVRWGDDTIMAHGIGAYIAKATADGDYPRIVLGVCVMSLFVILFNRALWRPLSALAETRLRLD